MFSFDKGTGDERFSTFPQFSLEVRGVNEARLKSELFRSGVYVTSWDLLDNLRNPGLSEQVSVVKFQLRDVGIRNYVSGMKGWDTLVSAIRKEGLELCPQSTAPEMALLNPEIIGRGEYVHILSEPVTNRSGFRNVFGLRRHGGRLELHGDWPGRIWNPGSLAVARLR